MNEIKWTPASREVYATRGGTRWAVLVLGLALRGRRLAKRKLMLKHYLLSASERAILEFEEFEEIFFTYYLGRKTVGKKQI